MSAPALLVAALAALSEGQLVYEVPPSGARLEAQRAPLFFAAPFTVRAGRVVRGGWTSSDELLGPGLTRVVVVASWCPACHELLARLSAQQPQSTVVLFLEEESERRGRGAGRGAALTNAASVARYPLAFHLLRAGSAIARRVTHYPMSFVCSPERCRPESR